jgi:membrane protein
LKALFMQLRDSIKQHWRIIKRVYDGFWEDDGFMLSGNLAYLALLGLFPFLIFVVSVAGWVGRSDAGTEAVSSFLATLPPNVADVLRGPVGQVVSQQRTGVLAFGLIVAVWTAGSVIETIRIVIHKAYDHSSGRAFWQYRIQSFVIVIGSTLVMLSAIAASFALSGVRRVLQDHMPWAEQTLGAIGWVRYGVTPLILFFALYGLYYALTPRSARPTRYWPGAGLTVIVWIGTAALLPRVLASMGSYDLTYGSLAGVMVALLFFYVVGVGFVLGAELNAALKFYASSNGSAQNPPQSGGNDNTIENGGATT